MLSSSSGPAFLVPVAEPARPAAQLRATAARTAALPEEASQAQWGAWGAVATAAVAGAAVVRASRRNVQRRSRHCVAAVPSDAEPERAVGRASLLRGAAGAGVSAVVSAAAPMSAEAKSMEEAQQALVSLGVPQLAPTQSAPGGWKFVVEPFGLASDANFGKQKMGNEPKAVTFICPNLWVISRPTIDFNGSAGTIGANDYGKGDSATLFVDTEFKGTLDEMKKPQFKEEMLKALTLKGKGFIENFKVEKVREGTAPGYRIAEYSYEIESEAGFQINRDGMAAFSQAGEDGSLQIFWTGVVTPRYSKDMQNTLNQIVSSFRVAKMPKAAVNTIQNSMRDFTRKDEKEAIAGGSAKEFIQMQY